MNSMKYDYAIGFSLIAAVVILILGGILGGIHKDRQNQECRLTAMTYGIPSAEIIQLCK